MAAAVEAMVRAFPVAPVGVAEAEVVAMAVRAAQEAHWHPA